MVTKHKLIAAETIWPTLLGHPLLNHFLNEYLKGLIQIYSSFSVLNK